MEYIIGVIIFILAMIVLGYFIKKKYYKEMDRLEAWKIDLSDRPVLDEMSKVKQLNMTGQTEELFERWRNQWDDLVAVQLPKLEELLFDAEECIDRYRFRKAKHIQQNIETKLLETEDAIKKILGELHELVGSEERNRVEIEQLKESYREAKKNLLAHRYNFGKAEKRLENQLGEVAKKFQEYEEKTANGNYLEARETVLVMKNQLETVQHDMGIIPQLLIECQSILPDQLNEIRNGFREMSEQGYYLEHLELESEISQLEEEIKNSLALIENDEDISNLGEGIKEIKARIEILFDLLEKEVRAKQFVIQQEKITQGLFIIVQEENEQLKHEFDLVQQSYHLSENEFEIQVHLDRELTALYKRFAILVDQMNKNDTAQTMVSEELQEIKEHLNAVRSEQQVFYSKLQALRKDELEAREQIKELTKKVSDAIRQLSKSNIPGLPDEYHDLFEDGKESIRNARRKLEEKPLNISAVHEYIEVAVLTIEKLIQTTNEMLETVELAEKVIQYGNRYRSQYPAVSEALAEAEKAFRNYDYQKAVEQAVASIQNVDPGAIKKIEALVAKEYSYK